MDNGQLIKLKIESYADEKFRNKVGEVFEAMFNPNQYSTRYEVEHGKRQAQGTSANAPSFSNLKSNELSLEFFLDGTGVAIDRDGKPIKGYVDEKADEFIKMAYAYDGQIHQSRYLRVSWASLVFDCRLQSANVTYSLFAPNGRPLRAKINAKFIGFVNDELRVRAEDASSPDLYHQRTVKGDQRIDALTDSVYQSPRYYIDLAKANDLVNFRKLKAGQILTFPPVVKGGADAG